LFGVAIMDGLLMISYFNDLRARGLPVDDAIMEGAAKRVRPVTMTALTAILGLLPAAFSTAIGAQTQRPLAIVVVGGMLTTLFLTRYLMPVLYSFYGHREPVGRPGQLGRPSLSHQPSQARRRERGPGCGLPRPAAAATRPPAVNCTTTSAPPS